MAYINYPDAGEGDPPLNACIYRWPRPRPQAWPQAIPHLASLAAQRECMHLCDMLAQDLGGYLGFRVSAK